MRQRRSLASASTKPSQSTATQRHCSKKGPKLVACFELLRRIAARPAVEVLKLLDAAIFNLIAGNADAHGKNFSILYEPQGARLAPLYDLLATVVYPGLSPKLAMKLGKQATLEEMDRESWVAFAADAGLGLPLVRRRIVELSADVRERATEVASALEQPGLDAAALARLAGLVRKRAERCALTIA
jgi:serine/threonine-protein kinase HipA